MIKFYKNPAPKQKAFTLVEVLAALTIASLTLVALFTIYTRVTSASAAITNRLDENVLAQEILQRIAEDLDKFGLSRTNTQINIQNKLEKGHQVARMAIESRLYADNKQKRAIFKKVVWQCSYDPEVDNFIIYRAHSGLNYEDKLLEAEKTKAERELFTPLCSGVTYFKIEALKGRRIWDKWVQGAGKLPWAVVVTISFAEPFESPTGGLDVPQEEKITRTIAIDRTRKITFMPPDIPDETP